MSMAKVSLLIFIFSALTLGVHAQDITAAAAADLRPALEELATHFQANSGIRLRTIYGSSGDLFHQVENGAPFDVFLSANVAYPQKLQAAGEIVSGSYYEYARGKIVLIVGSNSTVDLKDGLNALLDPAIKKVAIADPEHAPYGQAAIEALKAEKLYDKISSKIVTGENVSQTVSFVISGAADAGIVAASLVATPSTRSLVQIVEISSNDYAPIWQACVVLHSSKNQSAASKFESFLRSDEAAGILRSFGFEVPNVH